jgi:hypothetical protein
MLQLISPSDLPAPVTVVLFKVATTLVHDKFCDADGWKKF